MTDMVERVARALCLSGLNAPDDQYPIGFKERYVNKHWGVFYGDAITAIKAMREPTEHECIDEHGSDRWGWTCGVCGGPKENWERIIDSALKENPNETN